PQGHHDRQDDAEPDRVPTVGVGDGHQQGHEDQENGNAVKEHADDHQQHDDERQDAIFAYAGFHDGAGDGVDDAQRGQRPGEDARQRHHQHDHGRELRRFAKDDEQVPKLDGPMHHHAHEQAVEHGHHGSFRGREVTHAHAAQYDDRRRQPPDGFVETAPER